MAFTSFATVAGETTLGAAVTDTTSTSLTLATGGGAIVAAYLKPSDRVPLRLGVDGEIFEVKNINGDVVTVSRGAGGSTAATHSNSANVHVITEATLYTLLKAAIGATAPGS